jgi:hypothetical protein
MQSAAKILSQQKKWLTFSHHCISSQTPVKVAHLVQVGEDPTSVCRLLRHQDCFYRSRSSHFFKITPALYIHTQLGFDADMLELLMRELEDVVDNFFIIESTRTHNKVCIYACFRTETLEKA